METKEALQKTETVQNLSDVAEIRYLHRENTEIFLKNGFPGARIKVRQEDGTDATEEHNRIWLHRAFPFDLLDEYISVQNKDQEEIGLIRSLADFDKAAQEILRGELEHKYYTPKITKILSLKEAHGYSFWQVESDAGELQFTLQDTFRNLLRVGEDKVYVFDNYGNRYVIESLEGLDRHSLRKIELYL